MRKTVISVLAVLALCAGTAAVTAMPAGAGQARATIAGSRPSWATARNRKSSAKGSDRISIRVYLNLRNRAGLDAVATAVSNPKSASYHHYLSTAQMKANFDPTDASVASVQSWLRSQGLKLEAVPSNNLYVPANGTVSQVAKAFDVNLGIYTVRGRQLRSPDRQLSIPSSLAGTVQGVLGVDQSQNLITPSHVSADGVGQAQRSRPARRVPQRPALLDVLGPADRHDRSGLRRRVPEPAALRAVRLHPAPAARGLRRPVAGRRGPRRPRHHGGDRRRVLVAHHLQGRGAVRQHQRSRPQAAQEPAEPDQLQDDHQARGPGSVRRHRLVR